MDRVRGVNGHCRTAMIAGAALTLACALTPPEFLTAHASPSTLHVTTRLVEVNVVVHDKSGAPVAGLKRSDFTVLDDGKKQQISVFSVESASTPRTPAQPLPPNVFSNLVARNGGVPSSATVILLDGQETEFGDQAYAREQTIKFLRQLRPTDRVALYTLGSRLSIIQDFTSDPSSLIGALQEYSGQPTTTAGAAEQEQGSEAGSASLADPNRAAAARLDAAIFDLTRPSLATDKLFFVLRSVQAIAKHLSGLPGRKSLVWVTDGVPLPGQLPLRLSANALASEEGGVSPAELNETLGTIRALNEANVAIYPVDARGLFTNPDYNAATSRPSRTGGVGSLYIPDMAMGYWASETGGRAFYNTNDIRGAIRDALDDTKLTYTLGYYPNDVQWNGKYRRIKVEVDRKGVQVRYRRGYYAIAGESLPAKDPIALLAADAASPLDATGLGLTVRVDPLANSALGRFEATVEINAHGLTFRTENGRHYTDFLIWAAQYSRTGAFLGAMSKTISAALDESQYRAALAGSLPITFQDAAKPGAWQLRIAVRDSATGALGSVRIPLAKVLKSGP